MKQADAGWLAIPVVVVTAEAWLISRHAGTLSQRADTYHNCAPWLWRGLVIYVAGHLLRVWPRQLDPLHRIGKWADNWKEFS